MPESKNEDKPIKTKNMATRRSKEDALDSLETGTDNRSNPTSTLLVINDEINNTIIKLNNILAKYLDENELRKKGSAQAGRVIGALKTRLCTIPNMMTRHDYLSRARTTIRKTLNHHNNYNFIYERTKALHDPVATRYKTEYQKMNRANRNSPNYRKKGQTITLKTASELINIAENIIIEQISNPKSWGKLANSLSLVSGRRMYEVCVTANFQIIDNHRLIISGIAKQKNEEDFASRTIEFPSLINANLFLQGINTLRNKKDFSVFSDYNDFRKKCSNAMAKVLKTNDSSPMLFDIPEINTALTPKMMRQIYAAISLFNIKKQYPKESDVYHAQELAKILGHGVRKYGDKIVSDDIHTVMSYQDWVVTD